MSSTTETQSTGAAKAGLEGLLNFVQALIFSTLMLVTMFLTAKSDIHKVRIEAVNAGHARFVADGEGAVTFEWLPACGPVPEKKFK